MQTAVYIYLIKCINLLHNCIPFIILSSYGQELVRPAPGRLFYELEMKLNAVDLQLRHFYGYLHTDRQTDTYGRSHST